MNVLYKGVDPKEEVWYGECGICRSIVSEVGAGFNPAEIAHFDDTLPTRACPVCKDGIIIFHKEGSISAKAVNDELKARKDGKKGLTN